MSFDIYMLSLKIDEFVNMIFEKTKDLEWTESTNTLIYNESLKLSRLSNVTYDEIFDMIKTRYNKKLNVYKLTKTTIKKRKSIFNFFKS